MAAAYRVLEKVTPNDINQFQSIFFHDPVPYSYYDSQGFVPQYDAQLQAYVGKNYEDEMHEICSDSFACMYDYSITLDSAYAKITKQEETFALWLSNEATKKCKCAHSLLHCWH